MAAVALTVAAAGCTPGPDADRADPGPGRATVVTEPGLAEPTPEVVAAVAALPGRLAVGVGDDLALVDPSGAELTWLSHEAGTVAAQATWSPDASSVAWSRITDTSLAIVIRDLATDRDQVSDLGPSAAFYLQWNSRSSTLAYLRNDPAAQGVELGLVAPGSSPLVIGVGSPVFFSWAPGAPVLAAHAGAEQVLAVPSPLALPGETSLQPSVVLNPSGPFSAPAWLNDRTLLVGSPEGLVALDLLAGGQRLLVDTGGAAVQFVLSPDRARIAFQLVGVAGGPSPASLSAPAGPAGAAQSGPAVAHGGLQVLDLATGEVTDVADDTILAFQWSPDSSRLAWLEQGLSVVRPRVRWNVWDGAASVAFVAFQLSETTSRDYLPFFEQYAQSMQLWSPDGAAIAFAGRPDGSPDPDGIWVQLVDVPGAAPLRVADGDVVAWSPRPAG